MKDEKPLDKVATGDLRKGVNPVPMTYTGDALPTHAMTPANVPEKRGVPVTPMTPTKPSQTAGGSAASAPAEKK